MRRSWANILLYLKEDKMVYVKELLDPAYVTFLNSNNKEEALETLIHLMKTSSQIIDHSSFRKAVFAREDIMSTGIGLGVAIPHVKIKQVKDMVIGIGVSKNGIDWDSLDGKPVHIIFLIASSENQHEKYLRILAKIVLVLKNPNRRQKIVEAKNPEDILSLFENL